MMLECSDDNSLGSLIEEAPSAGVGHSVPSVKARPRGWPCASAAAGGQRDWAQTAD